MATESTRTQTALIVVIASLLAFGAGFGLGARFGSPATDGGDGAVALEKANARAAKAEAELAAVRETRGRPRAGSGGPAGEIPPDTRAPHDDGAQAAAIAPPPKDAAVAQAARATRLAEIRAALPSWFQAHDGEKVFAALRELAAMVPPARDDAMKLAVDINADVNGPGELGLAMQTFYSGLGDPGIRDLMTWGLENPASSLPAFRVLSAWSLPYTLSSADETVKRFEASLAADGDGAVQAAIIGSLAMMKSQRGDAVLARVFADPARPAPLRAEVALALSGTRDEATFRALESAAQSDPDARVRSAAKVALVVRDPPATGVLVLTAVADGNADTAGLRQGDVIVAYEGRAVATEADLRREIGQSDASAPVAVSAWRDGRLVSFQPKGGRLGVTLRSVTKK